MKKVDFNCKGITPYLDERIPKLDMVISGHLEKCLKNPCLYDKEVIFILFEIHYSLQSYINKFNL